MRIPATDTPLPSIASPDASQEAPAHDLEQVRANIRAAVNDFLRGKRANRQHGAVVEHRLRGRLVQR